MGPLRFSYINVDNCKATQLIFLRTFYNENIDICVLSEPHLVNKSISINPGYVKYINDRTAIIIKNCILHKLLITKHNIVALNIGRFILISCYSSPNKPRNSTINNIDHIIKLFPGFDVILVGDLNIRLPQMEPQVRPSQNSLLLQDLIYSNNLVIKNDKSPTFSNYNGKSIIDYLLVSAGITQLVSFEIKQFDLAFHKNILFSVFYNFEKAPGNVFTKLDIFKFNKTLSRSYITTLQENINKCNCSLMLEKHINKLNTYLSQTIHRCQSAVSTSTCDWWTNKLELIKNEINLVRKKKTKCRNSVKLFYINNTLKQLNIEYKHEIVRAKLQQWKTFVSESTAWGRPYKITIKKNSRVIIPNVVSAQQTISDDYEKCEVFLKHFLPNKLDTPLISVPTSGIDPPDVSSQVVNDIIKKLKNKKATSSDKINNKVIKQLNLKFKELLSTLINKCLDLQVFPQCWKAAELKLLPKPGKSSSDITAYRPISLLNAMGKVFEKVVNHLLQSKMNEQCLLHDNQFGFRAGYSAETAVYKLVHAVRNTLKAGMTAVVFSFDIAGAFDNCKWSAIFDIIKNYKFNPYLINVLVSYFQDRVAHLSIGDANSSRKASCGVPQGSVLGPTLWNLLYSDVHHKVEDFCKLFNNNCELISYADDLCLVFHVTKHYDFEQIKLIIEFLETTVTHFGLTFSIPKCRFSVFGNKKIIDIVKKLKLISGHAIEYTPILKYLGILIDNKLTFMPHLNHIHSRCDVLFSNISRLQHNTWGLHYTQRLILYKGLIQSLYGYGAATYITPNILKNVNKQQRKFLLSMSSLYRTAPSSAACVIGGVLPLDLYITGRAITSEFRILGDLKLLTTLKLLNNNVLQTLHNTIPINIFKKHISQILLTEWQRRWDADITGRKTYQFFPNITNRMKMKKLNINFYSSQVLSGHGKFAAYLYRFHLVNVPRCTCCTGDVIDDLEHFIFECPAFADQRLKYKVENMQSLHLNCANQAEFLKFSESAMRHKFNIMI